MTRRDALKGLPALTSAPVPRDQEPAVAYYGGPDVTWPAAIAWVHAAELRLNGEAIRRPPSPARFPHLADHPLTPAAPPEDPRP